MTLWNMLKTDQPEFTKLMNENEEKIYIPRGKKYPSITLDALLNADIKISKDESEFFFVINKKEYRAYWPIQIFEFEWTYLLNEDNLTLQIYTHLGENQYQLQDVTGMYLIFSKSKE